LLDKEANTDERGFKYCVIELIVDEAGNTLHYAVDGGSMEAIKALLKGDAKPRMKDVKGRTAEERATQKLNDAIMKVMQAAYSKTSP